MKKLVFFSFVSLVVFGCHKSVPNYSVLKKIAKTAGIISECQLNGQKVYQAGINAYDAGTIIYSYNGEILGVCNYAWGNVDTICNELLDCNIIYCVKNNIWGQPAVDIYGLN